MRAVLEKTAAEARARGESGDDDFFATMDSDSNG